MEAKIEGFEGLVRDLQTGAVISQGREALDAYRTRKAMRLAEIQREQEFANLKAEVGELKSLLMEILSKLPKQ